MAPEVYERSYDNSIDFWTLGINVFYFFAGELPFKAIDALNTIEKSIRTDPLPNLNETRRIKHPEMAAISERGCDFVEKLLIKNPDQRLSSKAIKEHPFFMIIDWAKLEKGELEPPIKPDVIVFYFFYKS